MKSRVAIGVLAAALCACQSIPDPVPQREREPYMDLPLVGPGTVFDEEHPLLTGEFDRERGELRRRKTPPEFRAMTWNLGQLTANTATDQVKLKLPTDAAVRSVTRADAVFEVLALYEIDIAALQEVYRSATAADIPLPASAGGYTVLKGDPVKRSPLAPAAVRNEHCPIAFRDPLDCTSVRSAPLTSRVHWARCTLKNTTKSLYFGCGHFSTDTLEATTNINAFFRELGTDRPRVGASPTTQDNFILGLDANSSPTGHKQAVWRDAQDAWNTAHPQNRDAIKTPPVGPPGTITKIYKNADGDVVYTGDAGMQQIDFLIHRFKTGEITYKPGSMQTVNIRQLNSALTTLKAFLREYYNLADHVPVKADYTY